MMDVPAALDPDDALAQPTRGVRIHLDSRRAAWWTAPAYRQVVEQDADVVCTLHHGMTRGLLEVLEPGRRLVALAPSDPERAGCRIELADGEREPR